MTLVHIYTAPDSVSPISSTNSASSLERDLTAVRARVDFGSSPRDDRVRPRCCGASGRQKAYGSRCATTLPRTCDLVVSLLAAAHLCRSSQRLASGVEWVEELSRTTCSDLRGKALTSA